MLARNKVCTKELKRGLGSNKILKVLLLGALICNCVEENGLEAKDIKEIGTAPFFDCSLRVLDLGIDWRYGRKEQHRL